MQQHLGEMLKAKLVEKQQPTQLRLFDDVDYIEWEINRAMSFDGVRLNELREKNREVYYYIRAIRDATHKFKAAERQWVKEVALILGIIN